MYCQRMMMHSSTTTASLSLFLHRSRRRLLLLLLICIHGLVVVPQAPVMLSSSFGLLATSYPIKFIIAANAAPVYSFSSTTPNGSAVDVGAYTADFAADCNATATAIDTVAAEAACVALGQGWHLAAIASPAAQAVIASLTNNNTNHLWLGGSDASVEGRFVWNYGRLKGTVFFDNSTGATSPFCKNYCHWWTAGGGFPNTNTTVASIADAVFMASAAADPSQRRWGDADGSSTAAASTNIQCYACERSRCNISLDCNATNTLSVNTNRFFEAGGYCGCACKDGFSGPRCNDIAPLVNISGVYNAQYMAQCAATPIKWPDAATSCAARGNGWALATIPTAEAMATVTGLTTDMLWLGGTDSAEFYVWRLGVKKGKFFIAGFATVRRASVHHVLASPACSATGTRTNPAGSATSKCTARMNDHFDYFFLNFCYACERSLCEGSSHNILPTGSALTNASNALFFYPNCSSNTTTISHSHTLTATPSRVGLHSKTTALQPTTTNPPATTTTTTAMPSPLSTVVTTPTPPPVSTSLAEAPNTTLPLPPTVPAVANIANSTCPSALVAFLVGPVGSVSVGAMRAISADDVTDALVRAGELVVVVTLLTPNTSFVDARVRFAAAGGAAVQDPRSLPAVVDLGAANCVLDRWGDATAGVAAFQRVLCRLPLSPRYVLSGPESIAVSVVAAATTRMCGAAAWPAGTFAVHPAERDAAVVAAAAVTTAATSVAVSIVVVFAEGSPIEIQLMVLLLVSACGSGADAASMAVVRFFVSPFVTFGPAWMAVGNVLLAIAVALAHVGVAGCVHAYRCSQPAHMEVRVSPTDEDVVELGPTTHAHMAASNQPVAAQESKDLKPFAETLASLMFPGVPLAVAQVLYAGATYGVTSVLVGGGKEEGTPVVRVLAAVLGVPFVVAVPALVLLALRRWAAGVWYERYDWTGCDARDGSFRRAWMRRGDFDGDYSDRRVAVRRVAALDGRSSWWSRAAVRLQLAVLPDGRWGPVRATRPLTGVLGAFRVREELWALMPLGLAVAGALLLTLLPAYAGAGCENVFVAVAMLAFVVSVLVLLLRPHRALLGSLLTALCLALLGGIAIAQVLAVQVRGADWPSALKTALVLTLAVLSMTRSAVAVLTTWQIEPSAAPPSANPVDDNKNNNNNDNPCHKSIGSKESNIKSRKMKTSKVLRLIITNDDNNNDHHHRKSSSSSSSRHSTRSSSLHSTDGVSHRAKGVAAAAAAAAALHVGSSINNSTDVVVYSSLGSSLETTPRIHYAQ